MRTIAIAITLAMTAGAALAQSATPTNNLGQQNAVSNQRPTDPLSGNGAADAGGSLLGAAAHNATVAPNTTGVTTQASTTQGVSTLSGPDTNSTAVGITPILDAAMPKAAAQPSAEAKKRP